jgi:hypothetical protein
MLQPHLLKATAAVSAAAAVAASIATATATIATATAAVNATVAAAAAAGNQGNAGQQWYYYHLHGGLSQNPNHTSPQYYTSKMEGHQDAATTEKISWEATVTLRPMMASADPDVDWAGNLGLLKIKRTLTYE